MEIIEPQPLKEKKPIGRAPNYTPSYYMLMAKEVVENGMSYREAGAKFKCSHGTVSHRTKLYREGKLAKRVEAEKAKKSKADTQLLRQEKYIRELKSEIAELYLENRLLKKAQAHFQQIKSVDTSVITSENLDQFLEGAE